MLFGWTTTGLATKGILLPEQEAAAATPAATILGLYRDNVLWPVVVEC